jgi:antitoxin HigA-1
MPMTFGLATITEVNNKMQLKLDKFTSPLPHPGEILREDFMIPLGLSATALSKMMGLKDRTRIERLSRCKSSLSPDTALRLARVFETSAEFWMNLQSQHDLTRTVIEVGADLNNIKPIRAAA